MWLLHRYPRQQKTTIDMTQPARILVVSYFYPPDPTGGGNRWATQAKYLRRLGHEVRIVTSAMYGELSDDSESWVQRTGDLASSPALRRLLRRGPITGSDEPERALPAPPAILTKTIVPDPHLVSWVPFATTAARRLVHAHSVDCIITSSPPESTHFVGPMVARPGIAWIADFRDGWGRESTRPPFPLRHQRALDLRLERWVTRRADAVFAATGPIGDDLEERIGITVKTVPNAWDPDLDKSPGSSTLPPRDGLVRLVHTGTLSGSWGRDPAPFLVAFGKVAAEANNLRLVLVGRLTAEERRLVDRLVPSRSVEVIGQVSRFEALAIQRTADALLLITSPQRSEATGKIFEYLAAGRPILALAEGNEAARIVHETRSGLAVSPTDGPAISRLLNQLASGRLIEEFRPRGLSAYRYPAPSEVVAETVESVVGAARQRKQRL